MANTRQQDFVLLAKGHYGSHVNWTEHARSILAYHALIELRFISMRDVAKILLPDLLPLLNEREKCQLFENFLDCYEPEDFVHNILSSVSVVRTREGEKWVLPFPECKADPLVKAYLATGVFR